MTQSRVSASLAAGRRGQAADVGVGCGKSDSVVCHLARSQPLDIPGDTHRARELEKLSLSRPRPLDFALCLSLTARTRGGKWTFCRRSHRG